MNTNKLQLELNQKLENKNKFFDFIKKLILKDNHTSLLDIIDSNLFKQLEIIYGDEFIKILTKIWEDTLNFTYESDPLKPAFRDIKNTELYLYPAISKLWNLLKLWNDKFNILNFIISKNVPHDCTLEDIIAYEIDNGNEKLLSLLSVYIEESNSDITNDIVRGIVKSSDCSLQLKLFTLILNEDILPELKKSILLNASCGNIEAFKILINFILENGLYSSNEVVDSIYGWTGVKLIFLYTEEIKLFFTIINDVLTDESKKRAIYSYGNESEYIFFSLWAEGLKDFSSMKEKLFLLNKSRNNIEVLNALHYLYLVGTEDERMEAAAYRLKKKIEPLYAYYVIQNYITSVTYPKQQIVLKFSIKEQRDATILSENIFLQDKASLEQHFEALYNLALDMNQYVYSYEKPFCWSEYIKDPDTIFYKLFDIIAYDGFSEEKIDRLCDIITYSTDETIYFFFINFIKEGRSEKQKQFILFLLKEGSSLLKEKAVFTIKKSKRNLTSEEKEVIINIFSTPLKTSHRVLIATHILGFQKDLMLEIVSEIVLARNDSLKKIVAEIFLKRLRNDNTFKSFLQEYKRKKDAILDEKKINNDHEFIDYEEATEKEKNFLKRLARKGGFGIYNSQNTPFLFDPSSVITSEISSIKNFFNMDLKKWEAELNDFSSRNFLKIFSLKNLLEIDFALNFENFFDLNPKSDDDDSSAFYFLMSNSFNLEKMNKISALIRKKDITSEKILERVNKLYSKFNSKEIFNIKMDIINCFFKTLSEEDFQNIQIFHFMEALFDLISKKDLKNINMFRVFFYTYYIFSHNAEFYETKKLNITHFLRAFNMKLISTDGVYKELIEKENSFNLLSDFFNMSPEERRKYSFDSDAKTKIISAIVKSEISRKNEIRKSDLTHLVPAIKEIKGASLLFSILELMEYERIDISTNFSPKPSSKKDTLNYFLSISSPLKSDTVETIRELASLLDNPYSLKKSLLFTAVHFLKWRPLLAEYLNYPYLDEVYWFFKAHLNYEKNLENRMNILKYTSIRPEEFEKGRFDINWFKQLQNLLGELEFEQIYESYKNSLPKSEVLERFVASLSGIFNFKDIDSLENEIKKQNKKALLCYSLLPYGKILDKSIENVYDTIRYHAKTDDLMTKTQSEITNIALNNFLDNIGFSSRIFLELKLDKEHQPLLRNFTKDDGITAAYITFIPPDKLVLKKYNAGELQSFQREKYIMKAYEAVRNYNVLIKDLIEYLKYAMNTRKELIHSEIFSLGKNPLTSFITKNIIFEIDKHNYGFTRGDSFLTLEGKMISILKSNKVKIAHPMEMPHEILKNFKNYFKENSIVQEFKQLDIEVYKLKNKDAYKKEISHFLDKYLCYNAIYEFLINNRWEKINENIFIKPYPQDNLAIKLEIGYNVSASKRNNKTVYISSVDFLNIKENKDEPFLKIPNRILSDILYDLNNISAHADNKKLK